jgi:CTP synthase
VPRRPPGPEGDRRKIALFTNVPAEAVIPALDADSIYKIPAAARGGLDVIVCKKLAMNPPPGRPRDLEQARRRARASEHDVNIAMVGKYVDLTESYKSLSEALIHAGIHTRSKVNIHYVDFGSDRMPKASIRCAAWTQFSSPAASASAASRARSRPSASRAKPTFRTSASASACSSPSSSARGDMAGLANANSTEFDYATPHPVVALITEWQNRDGSIEKRQRIVPTWAAPCASARSLAKSCLARWRTGSTARPLWPSGHRHRYEVNNHYLPRSRRRASR